jgi:hypothetical protein
MKTDMGMPLLDYALLRLSPNRTRCEMFVSGGGQTEKLTSGPTKPLLMQLRLAESEDQMYRSGHLIKLETPEDQNPNGTSAVWFNRDTIERFSNFLNNPEVIERINILESEISQLEEAKNFQLDLYSQDDADEISSLPSVTDGSSCRASFKMSSQTETTDTSKRELLRAIDARLRALHKELSMAIARADAAGFSEEHLENLLLFAQYFGATRLRDACAQYRKTRDLSGSERSHENGSNRQAEKFEYGGLDGQSGSISVDSPAKQDVYMFRKQNSISSSGKFQQKKKELEPCHSSGSPLGHSESINNAKNENSKDYSKIRLDSKWKNSRVTDKPNARINDFAGTDEKSWESESQHAVLNTAVHSPVNMESASAENNHNYDAVTRRLGVQATVSLFENKQNNIIDSNQGFIKTVGSENQRLLSTGEMSLRRWSGESDMSMDLSSQHSTNNENQAQICLHNSVVENTEMQLKLKVDEPILFPRKFVENYKTKLQLNEEMRKKARKLEAPLAGKFKSHDGPGSMSDALVMNIDIEDSTGMALKEPTAEKEMDENSGMFKSSMDLNLQLLEEMIENRNKQAQLGDECSSQDLRGKRYDLYMMKREAKLREEEPLKRLENEEKFKVMEKFLEQSKANIEGKRNPAIHASTLTQTAKAGEEETNNLFKEHTGNKQSKKVTFKNSALAAMVPPSSKDPPRQTRPSKPMPCVTTTPNSISSNKQRNQSSMAKNKLARSVPNFTDLKKENTKPSPGKSGFGFPSVYQKSGSFSYAQHQNKKKGCNQSTSPVQVNRSLSANSMNEKKRRNKDMMKSCASVSELKNLSGPRYERGILSPLKASKTNKNSSSVESRSFLTKGRGTGASIGPGTTETKVSPLKNMEYKSVDKQGSSSQSSNAVDVEKNNMGKHNRMNISYAQCHSDTSAYDSEEKRGFKTPDSSPLKMPLFSRDEKYREKSGHIMGGSDSYVYRRVTANSSQQFQQVSPEELKRFLNSGQTTMVSEAVNTEDQEDDFMRRSRLFPYDTSYGFSGVQNEQVRIQSLRASVPAWPANFELEEDQTPGVGSLSKAPPSCLSQSSFKARGNDPKSVSSTMKSGDVQY